MINRLPVALLLLTLSVPAYSMQTLPPEQEARAKALFSALHCVVCGGQSLAGSDAKIAQDIRSLIRDKIAAGEDDSVITAYLVERYGEGILMQPPLRASTLPLWFAPLLFLGSAALIAWRLLFVRRKKVAS